MAKAPSKGTVTERLEIYRRTDMSTGKEELFYENGDGDEKALGSASGVSPHSTSHGDGASDEVIDSVAPSTLSFGMTPDPGATLNKASPVAHEHGMPADPVPPHEAAGDPHPVYATDTALTTHEGAADPHVGYQKESEKGAVNGYASLDAGGTVPDAQIPAAIARDTEVTSAITTHEGAGDPHPGYALDSHSMASHSDDGALAVKNTVGTGDIDNDAVTYAKIQNVTDARLLGRSAGSSGDVQEITVGSGLSLSGGALSATGGAGTDPPEGSYAPGSYTIATEKFRNAVKRQQFTTTQRLTIQGTGRLSIQN